MRFLLHRRFRSWLVALLLVGMLPARGGEPLWDVPRLSAPPVQVEWKPAEGGVQEVYFESEPFHGKATRVFGYLARPATPPPGGRLPAMLLLHGGGGQAFRAWAEQWAKRGYVALALDLSGNGPGKVRLPDGGPPLGNPHVFIAADTDAGLRDGWTYHAVAAAIRGHSLLAALPEVDPNRTGLTGISWGGYLTCIVAGLDHRFKVAVPVYGCGFLHESSYWKSEFIDAMKPEQRARWIEYCDPSRYLPGVACPILFINGTNDPRFFLDSHRRSYEAVPAGLAHLSIMVGLKHGHNFNLHEVDQFVDAVLRGGALPPRFAAPTLTGATVRSRLLGPVPAGRAEMHYAPATGPWLERKWITVAADKRGEELSATLPAGQPVVCFFSCVDSDGIRFTSAYAELNP